jgi:hypothetical protein
MVLFIIDNDNNDTNELMDTMYILLHVLVVIVGTAVWGNPMIRSISIKHQRYKWKQYIKKYGNNPRFVKRHLRMTLISFNKLLSYIKAELVVNEFQAARRGGAILPELCLFCTLRWLAGSSYLDIYCITGVSIASFYRVVYKTLRAIAHCHQLEIIFPQTRLECHKLAGDFEKISYNAAIINCVGCIDGYLLRIPTPPKKWAGNVRSFFSGHYQCSGINIQAVCDSRCRFLYFGMAAPGSANDRDAIKECEAYQLIHNLPSGFVVIGDAAYEASEHLVPMYYGQHRKVEDCDNFNFYASQCRIRIEMAFGLMQMKWGILWRPLRVQLTNMKFIMIAIARLHNFTIDEGITSDWDISMIEESTGNNREYIPTEVNDHNGDPIGIDVDGMISKMIPGTSEIREVMLQRVKALGLTRPKANKITKNI